MNRLLALATWIFLSFFLIAPLHAASDTVPVDQQQAQQDEANGQQATPTTPAAALTWQEREKSRYENKKRAAVKREMEINKENAKQTPPETQAPTGNQVPPENQALPDNQLPPEKQVPEMVK